MYIPVMPLALLCNCFIVASLRLVLVGWVSVFLDIVVYMFLVAFLFRLCICCIASSSCSAYPVSVSALVRVFSGLPPCVG